MVLRDHSWLCLRYTVVLGLNQVTHVRGSTSPPCFSSPHVLFLTMGTAAF